MPFEATFRKTSLTAMAFWLASVAVGSADDSHTAQGAIHIPGITVIHADVPQPAPPWALLERELIESMDRAGVEFVKTYTNPDGTLRWKEKYEGGMNSSDDAYEGFRGFSLHHILGGSKELDTVHRHVWEGITRQFSRYGQIYREFDSNWDWMHHGEGYVSFYPLGLADPYDERFRQRAERFAAMYIGEDPEATNYDSERKLIRAPMNGSRGPKLAWTKRDWIPTNANLVYYHLPFDDILGVDSPTGWINDHPDDDQFGRIVKVMSERMAKGDAPINLTAVPLIANAYLYSGDEKYRRWITEYIEAWEERTRQNNGITPDNVGLTGRIGEYNGGRWWGGYYGWKWVRGGTDIVIAETTAAKAAMLLTGDGRWLELPRSQMAVMRQRGKVENGRTVIPIRYDDTNGWHHFQPEPAWPYVNLWYMSQSEVDWRHVERLAEAEAAISSAGKKEVPSDEDLAWTYYLNGEYSRYPVKALTNDLRFVAAKMHRIRNEHGDPETWFDAHWLSQEPMPTDNLVRLTIGGLPVHKRGEMLHSRLRYFDAENGQPGLPQGVAALVTGMTEDSVAVEIVNTNLFEPRRLIVQGGAYGEHGITSVAYRAAKPVQPPGARDSNDLKTTIKSSDVGKPYFELRLAPGAGTPLRIEMERFVNQPTYEFPWRPRGERSP